MKTCDNSVTPETEISANPCILQMKIFDNLVTVNIENIGKVYENEMKEF